MDLSLSIEQFQRIIDTVGYRGARRFPEGDGRRDFRDGFLTALKDILFDASENPATEAEAVDVFALITTIDTHRKRQGCLND